MRIGFELPPQQRVHGGFFIYSFCRRSFGVGIPLIVPSLIFADALGNKPIRHEID